MRKIDIGLLPMGMIETKILRDQDDVDNRLSEMGLRRATLLVVRDIALSSAANATALHPLGTAGTYAYREGTWALRNQHVGTDWERDIVHQVEGIRNKKLNLRVIFSNVDIACDEVHAPKPRSSKGAGSERACMGNLFSDLPGFAENLSTKCPTYYLMVDERGATELTCAVVKDGTFKSYIERIYLSDGSDVTIDIVDDNDQPEVFDPIVARK